MLSLIKKGSKLENEELKSITGSHYENCGSTTCNNCGTVGNDKAYDKSWQRIYWDFYEPQ
jgi:hypothetical protein